MPAEELINELVSTTTTQALSTSGTTVNVLSAASFPRQGNFRVKIDSEICTVTRVTGSQWTILRGQEFTTAATHSSGAAAQFIFSAGSAQQVNYNICAGGRLSALSGVAVPTGDGVSYSRYLYYVPYVSDRITLPDPLNTTVGKVHQFGVLSLDLRLVLQTTDKTNFAFSVQDVFVYDHSGVVELTLGPPWTGTDYFALSRSMLNRSGTPILYNGMYVNSGQIYNVNSGIIPPLVARYIGTVASDFYTLSQQYGSGIADTPRKRYIYNFYNRVPRPLWVNPNYSDDNANTSWSFTNTTITNLNGSNDYVDVVNGMDETAAVTLNVHAQNGTAIALNVCIAEKYTNNPVAATRGPAVTDRFSVQAGITRDVPLGFVRYYMSGFLSAAGTSTIFADIAKGASTRDLPMTYLGGHVWA